MSSSPTERVRSAVRRVTAPLRALPSVLIIGAQKAGTTSLFGYLRQHPAVSPPVKKELNYFSRDYYRGAAWYRAQFPLAPALTLDASPNYLFHWDAAERAAQHLPQARIIALLRDPVERAYSHYQHVMRHREPHHLFGTFDEALAYEARITAEMHAKAAFDEPYYVNHVMRYSFRARGRYAEQLERWLAHYPREQLLVLRSEAFFADPAETLRRCLDFIGVAGDLPPIDFAPRQVGRYTDALDARTRAELAAYYEPENERLYALLGEPFEWAS